MLKLLTLVTFSLVACGSSVEDEKEKSVIGMPLQVTYTHADGNQYSVPTDKPLLLAFSGSFCGSCNTEVDHYVAFLKGKDPKKVKLLTLSTSDSLEDALQWKADKRASWEFGIAKSSEALKYCPRLVPCNLVVKNGVIIHREVGVLSPRDAAAKLGMAIE
jgi:hypothetical protein